ncbi:Arc family DNA-binding protein [Salmonella enterica]|nr:Arc family DNA-binding protein [Salmonella enterica]EDK5854554.1 Arc family DNA-binding protein [Salmonella enterica subsp. enterica serovar Newport]EDR0879103.1 Arc family DNA-binding protein [Salmonella enterica]EHF7843554.1 Arc family DNA-binding protein [Salmonella enterica]EIK4679484.1 Arc family DNA-binding protein [Salmonella enterica]
MKGASLIAPFGLRMPEELKEKIAERAKNNGRSMNAEIVQILQDAIEFDDIGDTGEAEVDAKKLRQLLDKVIEEALGNKKPT